MTSLPPLDAPAPGRLTTQYAPADGSTVTETPPRFTWIPVIEDEDRYALRVSQDAAFPDDATQVWTDLPLNMHTPDAALAPGDWYWSYTVWSNGAPAATWSEPRRFTVPEGVPETPLPPRATRYATVETAHPRLWLSPDKLAAFKDAVAKDPTHCVWDRFLAKSAAPWMDRAIIGEPKPYPRGKRVAKQWRATYIECQEVIYAIRHLAIAGKVTGDTAMLDRARDWLLSVAAWDPEGTTSRAYTDEWAFRINVALAWGYDWLHDHLTDDERTMVRTALLARTRQTADHIIVNAHIHMFPFDSHAVRAVSMVLVPACIAMFEEEPEARAWLDYSIEFLMTAYSPWGDAQGGWAEGAHYWMTGMAYLIEAANLLKSFIGIDLYRRPFFRNTGDFPLFTKAPTTRRATFGDDSTLGDTVCIKMGANARQFAGVTGHGKYQWYCDRILEADPGTEHLSYNYGWWDMPFDEMTFLHDYGRTDPVPPDPDDNFRHFEGVGWACIQHRMDDPTQHIQFNFKSSPYGSVSHSNADQNAFTLSAFGEDLAVMSGYYVAYNSSMHRDWRRQTRSKNAILIDGKGQYGGMDKAQAMQSAGRIVTAEKRDGHIFIQGDATAAYRTLSPNVTRVLRDVHFVSDEYFVIVDTVDAETPVTLDWLLHANAPMKLGDRTFRYTGDKAGFYGQFLWSEAGLPQMSQTTGFPDIDPVDYEGRAESTCLTARFPKSTRHRIATLLVPYPLADPRRVFSFLDDQGYDVDLYFTDTRDQSYKVTVPKSFEVDR